MEIPVYDGGEKAGRMEIRREGLYTVFETRLPAGPELTRLWLAGGGESAYLGLMEPGREGRTLRRRLSALELRRMPEKPEYASTQRPAPGRPAAEERPAPKDPEAERTGGGGEALPAPGPEPVPPAGPGEGEPEAEGETEEEAPAPAATGPPAEGPGLLWFSRPDGSLSAFDGRSLLLALPARLRQRPAGLRLMQIDGREYLVFRA